VSRDWTGDHLPDPDLITWTAEHHTSFLSRLSPWTRVLLLAEVVVLVIVMPATPLLALLYLVTLAFALSSGLPARQLLAWSLLPALAVLSLVLLLIWGEPGTPVLVIPLGGFTLTLTDGGISLAVSLLFRALASFTATLAVLATTRYADLTALMDTLLPYPADQILLLAYRFIFITLSMVRAMQKALWSRGGSLLSSAARQTRVFADAGALVFLRSYDRAERIGKAMESRGYTGSLPTGTRLPRPGTRDGLVLLGAWAFGILLMAAALGRTGP
jgi:cobalt/nickel transport system permease protein